MASRSIVDEVLTTTRVYSQGGEFRPGSRQPVQTMMHWETW